MRTRRARGNTLTVLAAVLASAGVLWAGIAAWGPGPGDRLASAAGSGGVTGGTVTTGKMPVPKKRRAPSTAELHGALAKLNLTPATLAAAGLSGPETTTLIGNARQYLTDNPEELSGADSTLHAAQAEYDRLESLLRQGQSTPNDRAAFEAAQATLGSAIASRDSALASLRTAALAGIAQPKQDALASIRTNFKWRLPVQYLVVARPDADWVTLRDALSNDAQASATQTDPDPTLHQALLDANAVPATLNAAQNLATRRNDVVTAFNAAVQGG